MRSLTLHVGGLGCGVPLWDALLRWSAKHAGLVLGTRMVLSATPFGHQRVFAGQHTAITRAAGSRPGAAAGGGLESALQ